MSNIIDKIKIGTIVRINDDQAMIENMKAGEGVHGIDYKVIGKHVVKICTPDFKAGLPITYTIIKMEFGEETLLLVSKLIENEGEESVQDLGLFFSPDGFALTTRKDLIENNSGWMFIDPGTNNYEYSDLKYADWLDGMPPLLDDDNEVDVLYVIKNTNTLSGLEGDIPVWITEYSQKENVWNDPTYIPWKNPRFIIVESAPFLLQGNEYVKKDSGGLITLLFGCDISKGQLEVY